MSYQGVTLLSRPIGIIDSIGSCHELNLPGKKNYVKISLAYLSLTLEFPLAPRRKDAKSKKTIIIIPSLRLCVFAREI